MGQRDRMGTAVISALRRCQPQPRVLPCCKRPPLAHLSMGVRNLVEIRRAVEKREVPDRQRALCSWLGRDLPAFFVGRVVPIDGALVQRWAGLQADRDWSLAVIKSLLAATALEHTLVLVTRNLKDLAGLPVIVANPWLQQEDSPL